MFSSISHDEMRNILNPQFLLETVLRLFVFYFRLSPFAFALKGGGNNRNIKGYFCFYLFKRRLAEFVNCSA